MTAHFFRKKNPDLALGKKGVCSSSISDARANLSWEVFPYLMDKIPCNANKWKGHLVRAVDGTKLTLSRTEEILKEFPIQDSHFGKAHYPKAVLVSATEMTTGQITHARLGNKHLSENETLGELLPQFSKGDISLVDRGFRGKNLWFKFHNYEQCFLARFQSTGSGVMKEFKLGCREQVHEIVDKESGKAMFVRIIKGKRLANGQNIYLITNLIDKKKYKRSELCDLYLKRQVVEESFKQIKKQLTHKLEYRAKKINTLLQEIYAATLAQVLTASVKASVTPIKARVISYTGACFALESDFCELLFGTSDTTILEKITETIEHHYHQKQPGRSYPRYSRQAPSKWTSEKRKKTRNNKNKGLDT